MAAGSTQGDHTTGAPSSRVSSTSPPSAGDPLPANCELMEVRVSELNQLFNGIDPSPFRERNLGVTSGWPDDPETVADTSTVNGASSAFPVVWTPGK